MKSFTFFAKMNQIPICTSTQGVDGCQLYVDGVSRGNPGPAAVGAVIKACLSDDKRSVMWRGGKSIGKRTKNEADYEALLFGLEQVLKSGYRHVFALSNSEVLEKQFKGRLMVESPELRSLLQRVKEQVGKLSTFSLSPQIASHVRFVGSDIFPQDNTEADSEANEALDKAIPSGRLQEDSSCPVCLEWFEPPVFQCPKGHLICKECLDNLLERSDNESCPECRTPYLGLRIPNVVADDLIKQWRGQQRNEKPLATYKLSPNYTFDLTQGVQYNSGNVGSLNGGSYVDIMEMKRISHENRVRGRTVNNKWLTIQKGKSQVEYFANPLPTGVHKITSHKMPLWNGIRRNSTTAGELQPGEYVDVVETRRVAEDDRVRAKTAAGKWISLLQPSTGHQWATPVVLGAYKVINRQRTYVGAKKSSLTNGEVRPGDYVNVIEIRIVPEDNRVRASDGRMWMSIASTNNDFEWAKPRDVAEAEEEERRQDQKQNRTCSQCNRVFVHARARDQHYQDSHQLSCQGNVYRSCLRLKVICFQAWTLSYSVFTTLFTSATMEVDVLLASFTYRVPIA